MGAKITMLRDENELLKEHVVRLMQETEQLKEQNRQLAKEGEQLRAQSKRLAEEGEQLRAQSKRSPRFSSAPLNSIDDQPRELPIAHEMLRFSLPSSPIKLPGKDIRFCRRGRVKMSTDTADGAAAAHEKAGSNGSSSSGYNLVGFSNFVRHNPKSDRFNVKSFHHVEFWSPDATNCSRRFSWGLGMPIVAKSDLSTGNPVHASYLLRSGDLRFLFTAPYSPSILSPDEFSAINAVIPTFSFSAFNSFVASHGLAVRAIAIEVEDAEKAFSTSVANGAKPSSSCPPRQQNRPRRD
ncbi:hypothetical protein Nepgr_014351 [Nepenthes gracilis]|uniref:4-hydroxyphenylpyruvate dioxygenase n=1 Tax=Nepenthes gracilis TaxID=150966 RepID=A0AAD3XQD1_NEPGR|nr:hypothetical protein Nepgr_014351 [Nepenthes gracilis]